ncbi:putative serine/threonine-protein kinase dyrk2 [Heracleum sosnowskyi]|uniref:Serine/threonine-protein kinase dyrk2 n=1 Tax=Heracleum sosnowskyi TaxID=360622 RepID=A0AAD8MFX2_9APIA|nr:putative serine/threonine-protein kinase dyrk2 [Heracleum sosnowskyi]
MEEESNSEVDFILEFLKRNKFSRAEAALRSELGKHPDLNGLFQKLSTSDKEFESEGELMDLKNGPASLHRSVGVSCEELIVKEIECGTTRIDSNENRRKVPEELISNGDEYSIARREKNSGLPGSSENNVLDLHTWKLNQSNSGVVANSLRTDGGNSANYINNEKVFNPSWLGSTSTSSSNTKEKENGHSGYSKDDDSVGNPWSRNDESTLESGKEVWKDCSVKTVLQFPKADVSASYDSSSIGIGGVKDGKRKSKETNYVRDAIKEQEDEVGRGMYFGKTQEPKTFGSLGIIPYIPSENHKEEFPRLAPVKLKSEDKPLNITWEEKFERDVSSLKINNADAYLIGSFIDVPIGQQTNSSGGNRPGGGNWLSVSQGICEDTSDLVSGFATIGDGLSEAVDYPNEFWDSDEYDDDDDVGYMRQPIEDETWFLAHEIDYPSDNEKGAGQGSVPDPQERCSNKDEDDDQSFAEGDSYIAGDNLFQSGKDNPLAPSDDPIGLSATDMYGRTNERRLTAHYDGQLIDKEELNLRCNEPVWQGFVAESNDLIMLGDRKVVDECERPRPDDIFMDDDQHDSVRSIGVGINSDVADFGSEVRESLLGGSSEGDMEYFNDQDVGGSRYSQQDLDNRYNGRSKGDKNKISKHDPHKTVIRHSKGAGSHSKDVRERGFAFPPPRNGPIVQTVSSNTSWSNKGNADNGLIGSEDMLALWKQRSSDSSPVRSSCDEDDANAVGSTNSSPSTNSKYGYIERAHVKKEDERLLDERLEDPGASLEDEEAAAVQEQVKQIKAQEEEFETFNLKIVHRKNRTGFEEDKNFNVVINSVLAGRYHVTEYLGSAAFSKAIQAHDLHTGMDVCVKIIKNNKDFFDQSLDEIKLLKFINKNDPGDKYHILRLYDYFYYREHLLIVCELLKANLYEFHKFNRESGGEVYFTMPRLQSITIQCLEALQFLHGIGLIHCDLKPENILVKSYSRCEVKVIDLGSSCFETDHLCSYVQSRSYRAPEVILGLQYDKKIDIWSLGCILAELCTGNVLFQNDSPATLLARVIGIIGPIDQYMLAKGRETYKYFTKNHMLYERNQDTNRLEYLIPKKTSLRHRLPMGDQGFIDFVNHLLEVNPKKRPSASEALKHPWLSYPYEPISS